MDAEQDPRRRMVLSFEECRRKHGPVRLPRRSVWREAVLRLAWLLLCAWGGSQLYRLLNRQPISQETGAARSQQEPTTNERTHP